MFQYRSCLLSNCGIDKSSVHVMICNDCVLQGHQSLVFNAVDSNNDNLISADEFSDLFTTIGLDHNMAPAIFKSMDTNDDGLLDVEEFPFTENTRK